MIMLTIANNAAETLPRTISSVLKQKHKNLVYYICDNGSNDNTGAIIADYARNDKRVVPIPFKANRWRLIELISTIILEHTEGFFALLDADDEYKPGFLNKMLPFVTENGLDLAVCGIESVNAVTGEVISRKELGYDLILEGRDFLDKFTVYRRFVYDIWGKVYRIPALRNAYINYMRSEFATDGIGRNFELFNYSVLKTSERVGIFGESLHKYYVSPASQSTGFFPGQIEGSVSVYHAAREFLLSFGPMEKVNQDYLYAIYLGQISQVLDRLYATYMSVDAKFPYIDEIMGLEITKEMLAHEADPRFENLAVRAGFIAGINAWLAKNGGKVVL